MKRSGMTNTLRRLVGPMVFLAGMLLCVVNAEPAPLHWRQWLGLSSFGLLIGYAAYQCGWINGHHAGWIKARDEYRPNTPEQARCKASPGSAGCASTSEAK